MPMAGKQVAWGGEVEKMTPAMAKSWATEESMDALGAAGAEPQWGNGCNSIKITLTTQVHTTIN